jgi:hypothetical protein
LSWVGSGFGLSLRDAGCSGAKTEDMVGAANTLVAAVK